MPAWHDSGAGVAGRLLLGSDCVSLAAWRLLAVSDTRFCHRGLTAAAAESRWESARLVIEKSSPGRRPRWYLSTVWTVETFIRV